MPWNIDQLEKVNEVSRKLINHRTQLINQCTTIKQNFNNSGPYTTEAILSRAQSYATMLSNFLDSLAAEETYILNAVTACNGSIADFSNRYSELRNESNKLLNATTGNLESQVDSILSTLT